MEADFEAERDAAWKRAQPAWQAMLGPLPAAAPRTLKQVLEAVLAAAPRHAGALAWVGAAELRLARLQRRYGIGRRGPSAPRPRVLVLDATAPPRVAGWWIPDVVEQAGGVPVGAAPGAPPRRGLPEAGPPPDLLVLPAGTPPARAEALCRATGAPRHVCWPATAPLDVPGPWLYDVVESLAAVLHERP